MPNTGYCTLEDLRKALNAADLPGDVSQDPAIAVKAITAQTEPVEKELKRHWYAQEGDQILTEATEIDIPTSPKTRNDEEDIPTASAFIVDEDGPVPKTSQGTYAKITLARRDAESLSALHVRQEDGTYEDWAASEGYSEGSWPPSGEDYYLRVNNGGWSRLYLDTTNLLKPEEDDEYVLDSFANAVYLEWSYGHEGIPENVRRAVAFRAAADLTESPSFSIPDNSEVYGAESKASELREQADELLEVYK
ncbi:hypothetical protein [Halobacterium sp. CBA1126]|uniref:hypothetical protein n=1 Tax=Halobacterium sp. CBA1126 TaxID=2668074 RepID=UPI0012FA8E91|nr:hypothetical protein [Halobacterium sp. CBA1126]MUV59981.1 hypothetical protein [Halobacterium sp. CBA1126]